MLDGSDFERQICGEGEGISDTRSKNCEITLLGCWFVDDTVHELLFFVWGDGGLRGLAWEARVCRGGNLNKGYCMTDH